MDTFKEVKDLKIQLVQFVMILSTLFVESMESLIQIFVNSKNVEELNYQIMVLVEFLITLHLQTLFNVDVCLNSNHLVDLIMSLIKINVCYLVLVKDYKTKDLVFVNVDAQNYTDQFVQIIVKLMIMNVK